MISGLSRRGLLAHSLLHSGCGRILHVARSWRGLLVLNYHRIGDGRQSLLDRNLWSATTEDFDRQIRAVKLDFDVIGLNDLDDVLKRKGGRHVLITFDDGYLDNYLEAFPVLKAHRTTASFFLTTGFIDVPVIPWWDEIAWMVRMSPRNHLPANSWLPDVISFDEPHRDAAIQKVLRRYKQLSGEQTADYLEFLAEALQSGRCPSQVAHELWMTWAMIREMRQAGMSFGGHTVTHPILSNVSPEQQEFEVGECGRRIASMLGEPTYGFSYPVGGSNSFNEVTREALKRHGYRWAFTYLGGHARTPYSDRFAIPRTAIETDIDRPMFEAILALPQWFA